MVCLGEDADDDANNDDAPQNICFLDWCAPKHRPQETSNISVKMKSVLWSCYLSLLVGRGGSPYIVSPSTFEVGRKSVVSFFGRSWANLGPSWGKLEPIWANLPRPWANSRPLWASLGPSWTNLGSTWAILGPAWLDLGPLLTHLTSKHRFGIDLWCEKEPNGALGTRSISNFCLVFQGFWGFSAFSRSCTCVARLSADLRANLSHLGPFWFHIEALFGPCWDQIGPCWGHIGPSWGHLGTILWPCWGHLGAILAILRLSGAILRPSGLILANFWTPSGIHFGMILGPCYLHFRKRLRTILKPF